VTILGWKQDSTMLIAGLISRVELDDDVSGIIWGQPFGIRNYLKTGARLNRLV